jgi:hypothetical protein
MFLSGLLSFHIKERIEWQATKFQNNNRPRGKSENFIPTTIEK